MAATRSPAPVQELIAREEALASAPSESVFQSIFSNAGLGMVLIDGNCSILEVNEAFCRIVGRDRGELLGTSCMEITHEDDKPKNEQVIEQLARAEGQSASFEKRYLRADGENVWVRVNLSTIDSADGERVLAIVEDIGVSKAAEDALRQSEQRYRSLISMSDQVLYRHNADWSEMRQLSGGGFLADTEEPDRGWFGKYIHPEDQPHVRARIEEAIRTRSPFEYEHRVIREDGTLGWTYSRSVPAIDDKGEIIEWFGAASDVSARKEAEEALRRGEARFRTVFENAAIGMLEIDAEWRILGANAAYSEIAGYSLDELTGRSSLGFTHPEDVGRSEEAIRSIQSGDSIRTSIEKRYVAKDGRVVWVRSNLARVSGEGPTARFLKIIEDISPQRAAREANARLMEEAQREIEQRMKAEQALTALNETLETRVAEEIERRSRAEEVLRQTQKMETVGQLSGGIAHDFNNLLQIIHGNLTLLQRSLPDERRWQRSVANALTGTERAAALTQRLLAFSRRQPLDARAVDVNRLIEDMIELLHRTLGETIEIGTRLAADIPNAHVDENQLENAILNLAINARDAMTEGGELDIETGFVDLDERAAMLLDDAKPGRYVRITVRDNGKGMSNDVLGRAIEPFFSTKEVGQGTGLGLSMVYGFAKQSGGHLALSSTEGQGTTIELYLPCSSALAAVRHYRAQADLPNGHGERILVCEDDDDVRQFSSETLQELGYEVVEARDAAEAIDALRDQDRIDLLFTDIVLPGGKTGADLAREARSVQPDLKVLFTTGYARSALDGDDASAAIELLPKPFGIEDLAKRLRMMLD